MTGMAQAEDVRDQPQGRGLRERKKEQTRVAITRAAIGLFLERGFEQVPIAEIADAAGVAKQTVTNYFPNKEDLVINALPSLIPDVAGAVQTRAPGESPAAALSRFYRAELDRRAEWTQLHDGVTPFARMSLASPTLTMAFVRLWGAVEADLVRVFEEIAVGPDPGHGVASGENEATVEQAMAVLAAGAAGAAGESAGEEELSRLAASITVPRIRAQAAAGQVAATLRTLITANLIRQAAGLTTEETAAQSYAEAEAAFALLESGLSAFSR